MKKAAALGLVLVLLVASVSLASAAGDVKDLSATVMNMFSVGVYWNTTNENGPLFTVTCQEEGTDRVSERRTYHNYCAIKYLNPETTYIITVTTKSGGSASTVITIPSPSSYADFNYQLLDTGVFKSTAYANDNTAVSVLDGATLKGELSSYDYNFLLRFKVASTRQNKYLDFELLLRTPNGDVYTISDVLWYSGSRTTVTEYYTFDSLLKRIYNDYGAYPAGEYSLTAFIDNGIAAEAAFTVQ